MILTKTSFFRKRVKRKEMEQDIQRRQHQRKKIPVIYRILLQLTKIFIFQLIILSFNSNQINKLFNSRNYSDITCLYFTMKTGTDEAVTVYLLVYP